MKTEEHFTTQTWFYVSPNPENKYLIVRARTPQPKANPTQETVFRLSEFEK